MTTPSPQERLLQWFTSHGGIIHPSIILSSSAASGQHFCAAQTLSIPPNTSLPVCKCPFSLTLSHLNLLSSPPKSVPSYALNSICAKLPNKIPLSAVSYFFLAEQRLLGEKSFWEPYISALPKESELSTPLWFDGEDLKWLLGTTIHTPGAGGDGSGIEMRRGMWKGMWEDGVKVLNECGEDAAGFTWKLFLWAATIFTSRSFTSNIMASGTPTSHAETEVFSLLYPVLDSFNHRFGAKVAWDMDGGDFILSLAESTSAGREIYNNYAPKGNQELLMGYGFTTANNPCDEVPIRLGCPPPPVHAALRTKYPTRFTSMEWDPDHATFYLRGSGHYTSGYASEYVNLTDPMLANLPCLRGLPVEFYGTVHSILEFAFAAQAGDGGDGITEEELRDATLGAILERLLQKRDGIVAQDGDLPQKPMNARQEYAKIYRDGQVEILEEVIGELEGYLEES